MLSHLGAMLRRMNMIDENDLVSARFEACSEFGALDGSPVCAECGWLEIEHDHNAPDHNAPDHNADVYALPAPQVPKRLAS